jgi:hypothetical protein
MPGITYFVALPFDVAHGCGVVGEPIECPSPAAAIERAQGLWKVSSLESIASSMPLEASLKVKRNNAHG